MSKYNECPDCGASLDYGEKCTCKDGDGIPLCGKCGRATDDPWGASKLCDRCAIDLLFASGRSGRKRVIL